IHITTLHSFCYAFANAPLDHQHQSWRCYQWHGAGRGGILLADWIGRDKGYFWNGRTRGAGPSPYRKYPRSWEQQQVKRTTTVLLLHSSNRRRCQSKDSQRVFEGIPLVTGIHGRR
ncbi:unnamed protein product, partial [Ectocarpus sp. 8 AP-2014]